MMDVSTDSTISENAIIIRELEVLKQRLMDMKYNEDEINIDPIDDTDETEFD